MERWASNTLRVLGIVVTSLLMVIGCLLLLLLSLCSWSGGFNDGGGHKDQALAYLIGAVVLLVLSIFVIAKLAKGIAHSSASQIFPESSVAVSPAVEVVDHISPASQSAIRQLIYAIVVAMVVSTIHTVANILWPGAGFRPGIRIPGSAVIFLLYQLPYAILLVTLGRKPDRRAFAYAFAIPLASIILSLYTLPFVLPYFYLHAPVQLGFLVLSLALEALILWLTWRASQRIGYKHELPSVLIAGVVMLLYFVFLQRLLVPLLWSRMTHG